MKDIQLLCKMANLGLERGSHLLWMQLHLLVGLWSKNSSRITALQSPHDCFKSYIPNFVEFYNLAVYVHQMFHRMLLIQGYIA